MNLHKALKLLAGELFVSLSQKFCLVKMDFRIELSLHLNNKLE